MINQSQPAHPVTHAVATAIARRCVGIIEGLLRQEERPEAAREFYLVTLDELNSLPPERQQLLPHLWRQAMIERVIRESIAFLQSSLGKATIGLFGGVLCFCFPHVPGYAIGSIALYYCIHQFRPVAAWLYEDIKQDLNDGMQADGSGD